MAIGRNGVDDTAASAIAAWVDATRLPGRPALDPIHAACGAEIFARPEVGCAACLSGSAHADRTRHWLFTFTHPTDVPTLRGIGTTAPTLHNGSAPTLRHILDRAAGGHMGDTSTLSKQTLDDLEAFLPGL